MWTKGRKDSLQEEISEVLYDNNIEHDSQMLVNGLNKLNERELDQLRWIFVALNMKITNKGS